MSKAKAIYVVYANWCPHCVPTTVEPMRKAGQHLGIPVKLLDIDTEDEAEADRLVKRYGDWTPDYIIPQVFLEMDGGKVKHVLTGHRGGVSLTRKAVEDLLKSLTSD
jgi:thiol-disulfide isomerase/thioredoxin